jgi:hypothetical protein
MPHNVRHVADGVFEESEDVVTIEAAVAYLPTGGVLLRIGLWMTVTLFDDDDDTTDGIFGRNWSCEFCRVDIPAVAAVDVVTTVLPLLKATKRNSERMFIVLLDVDECIKPAAIRCLRGGIFAAMVEDQTLLTEDDGRWVGVL